MEEECVSYWAISHVYIQGSIPKVKRGTWSA